MFRRNVLGVIAGCVAFAAGGAAIRASGDHGRTLVVTMTNDADANEIRVYDAESHVLLQALSTHGRGGAGGNARGIRQSDGLVAAVNNGSNSVALFRRDGDVLKFDKVVSTTSAPVSVDFGNEHLYVAGATTVDSFVLHQHSVEQLDGTSDLALADGGTPPLGSTAQVGVIGEHDLLVTLKADPDPGTVDVVTLDHGRVSGAAPTAVRAPDGTLTPFGFATYPDGTALITLAHSSQDGLFRDGSFRAVIAAGQAASCWMTRVGKYVFVANTGSGSISRLVGTGNNVFVDAQVAAPVPTGSPADIDADSGVLGVIDHQADQSHLSIFTFNRFGELASTGPSISIGVASANGVAILSPRDERK